MTVKSQWVSILVRLIKKTKRRRQTNKKHQEALNSIQSEAWYPMLFSMLAPYGGAENTIKKSPTSSPACFIHLQSCGRPSVSFTAHRLPLSAASMNDGPKCN